MIVNRNHPAFIQPNDKDIVWRYMSIDKFESMLKNKSLFFCRTDRFSDQFEWSITKKEAEYRPKGMEQISNINTKKDSARLLG